jgi:hypothetical protein
VQKVDTTPTAVKAKTNLFTEYLTMDITPDLRDRIKLWPPPGRNHTDARVPRQYRWHTMHRGCHSTPEHAAATSGWSFTGNSAPDQDR